MAAGRHLDPGIFTDTKPKLEERCAAAKIPIHPGLTKDGLRAKLCLTTLGAPLELEEELCSVVGLDISSMKFWASENVDLSIDSGRKATIIEEIIVALIQRGYHSADNDAMSITSHQTDLYSSGGPEYGLSALTDFDSRCYVETTAQPAHYAPMSTENAAETVLKQSADLEKDKTASTTPHAQQHTHTRGTTRGVNLQKTSSLFDVPHTRNPGYHDTDVDMEFTNGMERGVPYDTGVHFWSTQAKKRDASLSAALYNEDNFRQDLASAVIAVLQKHPISGSNPSDEDHVAQLALLEEKCRNLSLEREALDSERGQLARTVSSQKAELDKVNQALQNTKTAWEADKNAQARISDDVESVKRLVSDFRGEREVQEKKLQTFLDSIDNALESFFPNNLRDPGA